MAELTSLKGRHAGQRGLLLGNGPSVLTVDLSRVPDGVVTVGTNRSWKHMATDYHVIVNPVHIDEQRRGEWETKRLVTTLAHGVGTIETFRLRTIDWPDTSRPWGPYIRPSPGFSENIEHGIYPGGIPLVSLQVMGYMGLSPIYLIGIDHKPGRDGQGHSYGGHPMDPRMPALQGWELEAIAPRMKALGIEVVNLNTNSRVAVFPKARFEDVFP